MSSSARVIGMVRELVLLAGFIAAVGCRNGTAPDGAPEGAPDFRGRIAYIEDDGRFRVDDGSGTACGLAWLLVSDATEIRWLSGRPARRESLQIGRRVSVWLADGDSADPRCSTIEPGLVVIEDTPLWYE
jgi:hypothetical protein